MTDPRSFAYYADDDSYAAAALAWRESERSRGFTEEQVSERTVTIITLRRPLPSLPAPLGPSETGIDWSHWNNGGNVIDFSKVRAAGHRYGWGKRTQGTAHVDRLGLANFNAARGVLDWIGNYHFLTWRDDGRAQAEHFSRTCGEAIGNLTELVDVELLPGEDVAAVNKTLAESNLRAFLARCEELFSRKPIIYTSKHYWQTMFDTARVADIARGYKFLVADWTPPLDLPAGVPWAHFHQKRADYVIPGLAGTWDLDEYRGDPPANWWEAMTPPYNLAVPNKVIQFYTENGVALLTKMVTWTMRVIDRKGDLLLVFDQVGTANDWWCKASDVQPAP